MWIALTLTVSAALAQQSPLAEGLVPYQFTFKNGDPTLYALVDEADLDNVSIPVVIDEPWNKRVYTMTLQKTFIDEKSPELSTPRRDRLRREWEAAGGVEVKDRHGDPYWVLQSDFDKQSRADRLSAAAFPQLVEAEPVVGVSGDDLREGGATGPGFVKMWGAHGAVIGGALALAGAVAWALFRRSWSPV
jgi:hypothetical protein